LDNENSCLSSQHTPAATDVVPPQGCLIFDVQQSPKKALRVAMMKNRFAETILKAQKNTLFDHVRYDFYRNVTFGYLWCYVFLVAHICYLLVCH
jgi:hypothetical protein